MKKVYLCFHHHSDLVWRRTKEGYNKVREEQILYNLSLFKKYPEFKFCFAQSDIIKTFLKENPEYEEEIKKLVKEKKIYFAGGIVSIPDTNLVIGESLVRNILLGRKYYKENFGVDVEIAWFMDAFGMSGQLPQILRKSNFKYLLPGRCPGLTENFGSDFLWEGIDGSRIITSYATGGITTHTHLCNLPVIYSPEERMKTSILEMISQNKDNIFAFYCLEEGFIEEMVFDYLKKFKEIEISQPIDYYLTLNEKNLPVYKGEFNPEFTGCYTSRIEVKKLNRKSENILLNSEKINSIAKILSDTEYDNEFFNNLWEKLSICQFHDGICGCHVDEVYNDLLKEFNEIIEKANSKIYYCLSKIIPYGDSEKIFLFNTNPWERKDLVYLEEKKDIEITDGEKKIKTQNYRNGTYFVVKLPPFGYKLLNFKCKKQKGKVINSKREIEKYKYENENYKVEVEENELKIKPKFLKDDVFDERVFEIVFREDRGDLWKEDFYGVLMGKEFEEENIKRIIEGEVFTSFIIEGKVKKLEKGFEYYQLWDGFESLNWIKEILIFNELKYILLNLKLNWKGKNTKILLSIPSKINPLKAKELYEIPFGYIERKPYFEVEYKFREKMAKLPKYIYSTSKGDWPALNWVYYYDDKIGIGVANKGIPGHQLNNGKIMISLLRSPTAKASGFIPDIGAYENGSHYYEFAVLPTEPEKIDEIIKFSCNFINSPLSLLTKTDEKIKQKSFLSLDTEGIVLSSFKFSENKDGYIIRFFETEGKEKELKVSLNFNYKKIFETDLMENITKEVEVKNIKIKPFEIKTFLIKI